MRRDTRIVIAMVGATVVLTLMALNFGWTYAALGVLAMAARALLRPTDILRIMLLRTGGSGAFVSAHFAGHVQRFAAASGIRAPRLLHAQGRKPTAMAVGSGSDSVILLRGAVHGLTAEEKEALIAHEMGHIANNHFLVKWATSATLVLALMSVVRWHLLTRQEAPAVDPAYLSPELGLLFLLIAVLAFIAHEWFGYILEAEADSFAVHSIGHARGVLAMLHRELDGRRGPLDRWASWPIYRRIRRLAG